MGKWHIFCRTGKCMYIMARHTSQVVNYAPLYILSFPLLAPHTLVEAEKFNIRFPVPSMITEVPDKLRWYRYKKSLLQREVADYAGIDRSTYSSYEKDGRDYYPIEQMEKIAALLDVPVTELLDAFNLFLYNDQGKQINDKEKEADLVRSYVMSDDMADKLKNNMLSQLRLDEVVDNKGVLLVGNYGTGKSHLMSLISAVARDADYLSSVQNRQFASDAACIAGQFEVLRIEIGAVQMSLRNIILNKVKQDFADRGLSFAFPDEREIITNKEVLLKMMEIFASKYVDRGYLIVVDEFLDYLGGRKEQEVKLDLGFMRELGEIIKSSRLRAIFGVQEKLFDNPNFAFVSQTLNRVKDRFEQVIIRKEDTAYNKVKFPVKLCWPSSSACSPFARC